ncbi:type II secretion system protein [Peribacillus frigoritolerans]|uniref:type II secretion system protein n=1 Tax=Peribacillus frigoritolerans TaxID=450367 RepID=UPI001059AD73|nr:prepilin-type N-terminal cleavage/methylation domain-containing protein [Peribacillus frigoritolerans]TDL78999.1 prepilin-type N-terminal cleavage/methylation domain-containing protein [Peribacillus frigoritolerans]
MKNLRFIRDQRGFTLVELLAVIVILGIVFSIAVISLGGIKERTEPDVCAANRVEFENGYRNHLTLEDVEHSEVLFGRYLTQIGSEVCPVGGEIAYSDGHVDCSVHGEEVEEEEGLGEMMVGILNCRRPLLVF